MGQQDVCVRTRLLLWLPWIALSFLLMWSVRPPGGTAVLPPLQTVHTRHPNVGVHTRLTDEVEEWKIQRTLELVREMGATTIVEYFPWAYMELSPGRYNWQHSDMVVAHAYHQGLTVIARLGMVPAWARPASQEQETTFTWLSPDHYAEFADFVAHFVARYQGQVRHVIIWNEPNLSFEWGYRRVDPVAYTNLLRVVYPAAHQANPDVVVLGGALAPTLEPSDSSAGLNDLVYLEGMYQAGAAPYFDALAAHAYGLVFPPDMMPALDMLNFRRVELLRNVMIIHGDADKRIYVTEAGWNDHPRWTWAVRPAQRGRYTVEAYRWAESHWPWCPVVAMWMFRTPRSMHNYQDYYAFVTPDFQERPIYSLVQSYTGNSSQE